MTDTTIRRCPWCGVGHDVETEYDEAIDHYKSHGDKAAFVQVLRDCETLGVESLADWVS